MSKQLSGIAIVGGFITGLLGLSGCSSSVVERSFEPYLEVAPADTFSAVEQEPRLANFIAMFTELNEQTVEQHISDTYNESFYFNDTFHSFDNRDDLKRYLLKLSQVAETRVWVLDVSVTGNDVLMRWKMNTKGKVMWRTLDIESVGITHLRFDDADKIILQQDYWDAVQGFYAHLPFIGSPLKAVRSRVGKGS